VNAPPDGYTLLVAGVFNAVNATLYEKLNYNFIRDIVPVAGFVRTPLVLVVNSSVPGKTVSEFIAYAKANPGKLNMASAGIGTGTHLAGELFKVMAGINIVHVPYRSTGPALTDLIGGQVHVMFAGPLESIEYIRTGKLRALALGTAMQSDALPDIPTLSEFLPGYEAGAWYGFGAPKNTSVQIIGKLNMEVNATLADPKMKARLAELGCTVLLGTPSEFGKLIADETEKWAKVIRAANIKAE
jgi:tripartite-type tricarboxylate transporter receptor subunit TctC